MSKKVTTQIFDEVLDVIKKTKDFTLDQVPDLAKEVIAYQKIVVPINLVLCLFFASFFVVWVIMASNLNFLLVKTFTDGSFRSLTSVGEISFFVTGGVFMFGIGYAIENVNKLIKLYIAPKLFITEYLINMLKTKETK